MSDTPEEPALPPSLRLLKVLVIILTITMIAGVITVVGLLVTRMPRIGTSPAPGAEAPALPPALTLPAGTRALAVTMGQGWIGVATDDGRLLVFLPDGSLHQEVRLTPLPEAN